MLFRTICYRIHAILMDNTPDGKNMAASVAEAVLRFHQNHLVKRADVMAASDMFMGFSSGRTNLKQLQIHP